MTDIPSDAPFGSQPRKGAFRLLRPVLFVVILGVAAGLAWWATRSSRATPAASAHAHGAAAPDSATPVMLSAVDAYRIGVTFTPVTLGPLQRKVRTVAQLTFDETRVKTIAPRIDGWVEQLFVDFTGQAVHKGDPLFTIYSPMLVSAEQELLLAKSLRQEVSQGMPDAVNGATNLIESARRRLSNWEVPAEEIERLEATGEIKRSITLRSPVEGIVLEKAILAGQRIMAGEAAYKVADLSRVWLEGEVFEQDLTSVRLGQEVTADFTALPGESRSGRITYIYPTLNPDTRTARVRVELGNPGLKLMPGMYATIWFSAPANQVLSVPRSALLSTGKRDLVFVRDSTGTLTPREVVLGIATDDRVEILHGLAAGETVVASATFLIDAESNLGSALSGMANMPGMERPPSAVKSKDQPPVTPLMPDMPGMGDSSKAGKK